MSENVSRASENILQASENIWEPTIVSLDQFEKDFITHTKTSDRMDRLSQTRVIPRSPDGENNIQFFR